MSVVTEVLTSEQIDALWGAGYTVVPRLRDPFELPKELIPDRLKGDVVCLDRSLKPGEIADKFYAAIEADKSLPWWPTLHAILLPIAIDNVRKSLTKETTP